MDVTNGLFYLFSALLLVAAFRVITARNPVHAALFLVLAFFQASGLWMLLRAEFLAITLVLVYVGAVMVLFLFVVMMLDLDFEHLRQGFWKYFPLAGLLTAVIAVEMAAVLFGGFRPVSAPQVAVTSVAGYSNTKELGKVMYTQYLFPLEVASVILLVAIVAAIALTMRKRKDTRHNRPEEQVRVKAADRMEIIKVAVTKPAQAPVAADAAVGDKA